MKRLVMLAIIAAICASGRAEVLVYKFNANYNMIPYTDPSRTAADKDKSETIKAYIVFNIDSNTPLNVVKLDAGNKPTAILYGDSKTAGKWKKIIGADDPNSGVLIMTAESDVVGFQTFNNYTVSGQNTPRTEVQITLTDNAVVGRPFEIVADMRGKDKKTGKNLFPTTIYLPWDLSGITSMESGDATTPTFVSGQATSGTLKMDFPEVQDAVNNDWNVAQTIADIDASSTLASYPALGPKPIPVP